MTHTFTKTPRDHGTLDTATITVTTEAESLEPVLAAFEDYLRACGLLPVGTNVVTMPRFTHHS